MVEAAKLFRSKLDDFDLAINDMTIPDKTGDVLAVELMKVRPGIPVILDTDYNKKNPDEVQQFTVNAKSLYYQHFRKLSFSIFCTTLFFILT